MTELGTVTVDQLQVHVFADRHTMARAAAEHVARTIRDLAQAKPEVVVVWATGRSQVDMLAALRQLDVPWPKVRSFHLDEYRELAADHPASFRRFLREHLFDHVPHGPVHFLSGDAPDPASEAERYAELLRRHALDLACVGIGENGHLAFNDPHVADFEDPKWVKEVDLDDVCRMQQVHDGWFERLEDVPRRALTLTIPAVMQASTIIAVVPGPTKRQAVQRALKGPVAPSCPSSVLRRHPHAHLYLDLEAAADVWPWEAGG